MIKTEWDVSMTSAAPAASALREQVARALAQCHGDQWAESEGEPVEGYGERFAFAWQAEADKCIALIRPAVLREAAKAIDGLRISDVFGTRLAEQHWCVDQLLHLASAAEAERSADEGRS